MDGAVVESRPELYLNRWRVYDPQVGQYTSPEPLALDGGWQPNPRLEHLVLKRCRYITIRGVESLRARIPEVCVDFEPWQS